MLIFICFARLVFLGVEKWRHRHHHHGPHGHGHHHDKEFRAWMQEHGKEYESEHEFNLRRDIFFHNKAKIDRHNGEHADGLLGASGPTYTLALNHFADLTADEFSKQHASCFLGGAMRRSKSVGTFEYTGVELPASVDWTAEDSNGPVAVGPVKNQGQCGSCWSFSVTGALEGAWALHGGKDAALTSLSEQQLIDCSKPEGNMGCNGGLMDDGFQFEEKVDVCSEKSYPYEAKDGKCREDQKGHCDVVVPKHKVTGFTDVGHSTKALMQALTHGPVSIAIQADQSAFQFYSGGVLEGPTKSKGKKKKTCCAKEGCQLDHGVLLTGYGTTPEGVDYWQVKNSWGDKWGDAEKGGYIKLFRDVNDANKEGTCGILLSASFPLIHKDEDVAEVEAMPKTGHYGPPSDGCQADELAIQLNGVTGDFCSPKCVQGQCPNDLPNGATAQPYCALKDPSGDQYFIQKF